MVEMILSQTPPIQQAVYIVSGVLSKNKSKYIWSYIFMFAIK